MVVDERLPFWGVESITGAVSPSLTAVEQQKLFFVISTETDYTLSNGRGALPAVRRKQTLTNFPGYCRAHRCHNGKEKTNMKPVKLTLAVSAFALLSLGGCVAVPVDSGYYGPAPAYGPPPAVYYSPPVYYGPSIGIGIYGGRGGYGRGYRRR
jgi:hypothetical protein